jgi:hypothetical protein
LCGNAKASYRLLYAAYSLIHTHNSCRYIFSCLFIRMSVCLSVFQSVSQSVFFVCLSLSPSVRLSLSHNIVCLCLSVCLSFSQSLGLFSCYLSLSLSICISHTHTTYTPTTTHECTYREGINHLFSEVAYLAIALQRLFDSDSHGEVRDLCMCDELEPSLDRLSAYGF